jgi:hypothetical protein
MLPTLKINNLSISGSKVSGSEDFIPLIAYDIYKKML